MMPLHSTAYESRRAAQRAFGDPHGDRGQTPDVVGPGASSAADETPAAHVPGALEMASRCMSCGVPLSISDLKTEPNCQACADGAGATHTASPSPEAPATEPGQHVVSSEAVAMGGPGSGWHAEQGHVPGSQGDGASPYKGKGGTYRVKQDDYDENTHWVERQEGGMWNPVTYHGTPEAAHAEASQMSIHGEGGPVGPMHGKSPFYHGSKQTRSGSKRAQKSAPIRKGK